MSSWSLGRFHLRPASLALVAVVFGAACLQGARAPQVPPSGTLAPRAGEAPASEGKAFAVVFGAPKGQTRDPSEITLVFNRPMRPLELAGNESPPPVTIEPKVDGRWQWVGTSALQFVPATHLPRATAFTVTVPAGTRALDGSTLAKPYVLKFSTARPAIADTKPYENSDHLSPTEPITVRFDQPVSDGEIARAMHLSAGEPQAAVPFSVRRPEAENHALAEIVPKRPLPLDATVTLAMDKSLHGEEGPLPAGEARSMTYHTYGPLSVEGFECSRQTPHGQCDATGGFSIELSNDVKLGDLKRALVVEPAVKLSFPEWMNEDQPTNRLPVMGRFVPGKTYRVRVRSGPRDVYGQPLTHEWTSAVAFDDLWPTAEIGVRGTYFEAGPKRAIPIASINVPEVELATVKLDESGLLGLDPEQRRDFDAIAKLDGARVSKLSPSAPVNAVATHPVPIADVLGSGNARGALAIAIRYDGGRDNPRPESDASIVDVTDLAISAKVSMHGSLVWVTHLSNGAPVAGASVSIREPDGPAEVFRTDAQGFASVPEQAFRPTTDGPERAIVFVRTDDDFAFRRVSEMLDGYRYGAPVELGEEHPFGMIFSDRGIYRPGDAVKLKGIVRQEGYPRTTTPSGRVVHVKVEGPSGETVASIDPTLSAFGTFAVDAKVPETGKLGTYSVTASVEGSGRSYPDVSATFEVAEYRPTEFTVGVESDRPSYVRGDEASWIGHGDFLFGAPMSGASVSFSVTRAATTFTPPGLEDAYSTSDAPYYSDLPDTSPREYQIATSDGKLDPKGMARIGAKLAMPGQRGPEEVTCSATVTDLSRQAITGSSTAIVHPAEFYLAIDAGEDLFVNAGKPITPRVLAVDPKGTRVPGVPVRLDLVQRTWQVAKQETGGAYYHTEMTPVDKVASSCAFVSGSSPAGCALAVPSAGYYLVRAVASDKRKNPVAASTSIYALGAGEVGWGDSDKQSVELVSDRKSYEVGQTARFLVKSPFPSAEALVTVERGGVYTKRVMQLAGPTPVLEVPVTEDLRPNAYVSVLLVRGRSKKAPARGADIGAPAFRMGYGVIRVDPESRRLHVAVATNKTDYRPGEKTDVDVTVRDRDGKPAKAELTLYAVDEGVLTLIDYRTPDPIPVFGAPRPLGVATIESRAALARIMNPYANLGLDKGLAGGGGGEEAGVRRDFRPSAFYAAAIVTDAEGKAHASFKLPDSLTTYRVMAVAVSEDDRFGYGEQRVTASRPLMARPAFPRVLRAGDDLDAGVIVTSKGLADTTVDVDLTAQGIQAKETTKRVALPKNGSVEVRFPLLAATVGDAKLRFRVRGGGEQDAVEITRKVLPPIVPEAVALYGDTTHASADALGDLSAIRPDVGGLEVSLSSTALVGLGDGVDQLIEYPYGCTEQLASRLVPLLPLRDMAADFALPLPKDTDKLVRVTVARILKNQRDDGGFGLWADSPEANPWVTAYALWALSEARRRKEPVPASALESATTYLRRSLEKIDSDPYMRATAPFVLDVLAQNGQPDPGRVTRMFEEREKLPVFSQALLLHAMVLSKSDGKSIDQLANELEGHIRIDGPNARAVVNEGNRYAPLMDSEARTSAMLLRGLLAARPAHPLAAKLAMGLLADRRGGTWRSTQETAWALLALDDYRKTQEKVTPDFEAHVFLGDAELFHADFRGRTTAHPRTEIPAARLGQAGGSALSFSVDGSGRLFYEARLRYARKEPPKTPLDRGFFVQKTLRPVTPEDLDNAVRTIPTASVSQFGGGDLVLADLVVVTPSPRDFVVVDDPLPAGLEAIDTRLATTGSAYDVDAAADRSSADEPDDEDQEEDARAMGKAVNPSWFLREVRDDRVVFFVDHMAAGMYHYRYLARATSLGHFVMPPTRAEEMYVPEVFGRSPAGTIDVAPKDASK